MSVEVLKKETISLCDVCFREISASVYIEDGKAIMKKRCPQHGEFKSLVENSPDCYKKLAHITDRKHDYFHTLTFPFTYRCNFSCEFCYLPNRKKKDFELEKIKDMVRNFQGSFIGISGGEPTLRPELPELIRFIKENNKMSVLYTNGLALEDINYARKLKKAGLNRVLFSFDGFDSKVYKLIKISDEHDDILDRKLRALENLKKEKIPVILSMTIYKGINDSGIQNVLNFALRNNSFIYELRIRTCAQIGRFKNNLSKYFMSGLLKTFEKQTGIKTFTFLGRFLCRYAYYTPHSVDLKLYFLRIGDKVIFLHFLSNLANITFFFIFKLCSFLRIEKLVKKVAYRLIGERPFVKHMILHFAAWPEVEEIDLGELKAGVAHLYDDEILDFCHAVILNSKL